MTNSVSRWYLASMDFGCWACYFTFERDEQIELLLGFIVPQLSRFNVGTLSDKCNILIITHIGNNNAPIQCQDAYLRKGERPIRSLGILLSYIISGGLHMEKNLCFTAKRKEWLPTLLS